MNSERLPERTVPGLFFRQADRLGQRTMLRHHREGSWIDVSWRQCADLVVRVASHLIEEGVAPGDRVLLISPSTQPATVQRIAENSQARLAIASGEALAKHLEVARVVRMDSELPGWLEQAPSAAG